MDVTVLSMTLLMVTLVLNVGHLIIHAVTTGVRRAVRLPWYDPWVGYGGALSWFLLVVVDGGTLGWPGMVVVPGGLALTGAGLYVHARGVLDIMTLGREEGLVKGGIYRRLRHPIYYGWVAVSFGLPLVTGSWAGVVTAPLWSALILSIGLMEERDMKRRFPGGEYEDYLRGTWF